MDYFAEYIVKRKKQAKDFLIIIATVILALIVTLISLIATLYISGLALLLAGVAWWGAYRIINTRNIEFEYILTNSELDIDKIMGKSERKRLLTIDLTHIERSANIGDESFEQQGNKTVLNYAGDLTSDGLYFIDFSKEAEAYRVIFQPSRRILEGLKKANPRSVTVRDADAEK